MAGRLARETAIVTGAGRGFGKAIALGLAAEGAAVTLTARSKDQLDAVAREIEGAGGQALAAAGDVTKRDDVERVVAVAEKTFGPTTVVVNNAGVTGPFGPVWVMDPDAWWRAQEVMVRGTLLFMRAVMPGMIERRKGSVINVASLGGQWFTPHVSCYGIGKMSQIRLSELAAAEAQDTGVGVYVIEPGTVITDMAETTMAAEDAKRWVPHLVGSLKRLKQNQDPAPGLARCAQMCVQLATGKYAALAGRFLIPQDDFDRLTLEPAPPPGSAVLPREAPRTT